MAFSLKVSGYVGKHCAECPFLRWTKDLDKVCAIFGELGTEDGVSYLRHEDCVQMEEKSGRKG